MPKILAVDDDLYILDLYKTMLTEAGYEVATAEDAMSAVTKFQEFKPDLLILDVEMPAGGGEKVFDRLRNLFMVTIPIIFSTGVPENVQRYASFENVTVLKKPVDKETLLGEIKRLLQPKETP
ncbi:MAG: response regulator [Elusimicrobiota bacterium]|nr:response regulator [Elusimicrobiota bacterium]